MEDVPTHVHTGLIVPDILTRQHEHRSGLIWSGDHETCITDLHCRCFGLNLFQVYSMTPHRLIDIIDRTGLEGAFRCGYIGLDHALTMPMRGSFRGCTTDKGALMLLQTWAWSRIPVLHPQLDRHVKLDPRAPLGAM
ncbi:hypothetical protein M9H77_11359 [Catharanthus roseus]|uniref:Uncharacterized protein n=1 Tax=Catharanthus roseus TaxID=4058 RepID=A0ACC0BEF0_CATRO|nr:hypothetical protein M9H77_11359 [Catharanthus roseus]